MGEKKQVEVSENVKLNINEMFLRLNGLEVAFRDYKNQVNVTMTSLLKEIEAKNQEIKEYQTKPNKSKGKEVSGREFYEPIGSKS